MPEPELPSRSSGYRDRSRRLTLFGLLAVGLGILGILFGLAHLLLLPAGRFLPGLGAMPLDPRSVAMSALLYGILGAIFVWAGIGSIRKHKWSRSIMLILTWGWLVAGLGCSLLLWLMSDEWMRIAAAGMDPVPADVASTARSVVLGLGVVIGVLLPGLFLWAYLDRDVLRTCEAHCSDHPVWSDRCPPPVLGLSLGLGFAAVMCVPMAIRPVVPVFGTLVTGWAGAVTILVAASVLIWLARSTFLLRMTGWWGTILFLVCVGASAVGTVRWVDLVQLYGEMGYPVGREAGAGALEFPGRTMMTWGAIALTCLSVAYMVTLLKHFRAAASTRANRIAR